MRAVSVSIEQLVRNQEIFREVNERIRELADRFDLKEVAFICECSREDCAQFIALELDEYSAIRSSPTLFMVVPGHETLEVENVVQTKECYALVQVIRRDELVTGSHQPVTERQP